MKLISAALVKAQKGFSPALKASINPHFKSRYVDLAGCVEAVIDSLNDNGIFLMQMTHESETGVTVETVFIHESGETFTAGKLHVPASKQDAQGYGSALTYARRYSLMAACGIAPEDDDGNAASKNKPVKEASKSIAKATQEALGEEATAYLKELAMEILAKLPDEIAMYETYESIKKTLDADEIVAMWGFLDSKSRASIKRGGELQLAGAM